MADRCRHTRAEPARLAITGEPVAMVCADCFAVLSADDIGFLIGLRHDEARALARALARLSDLGLPYPAGRVARYAAILEETRTMAAVLDLMKDQQKTTATPGRLFTPRVVTAGD